MGFAVFVEALNIRWSSRNAKPLKMHDPYHEIDETSGESTPGTEAPPARA
jgi:hypothetical protein